MSRNKAIAWLLGQGLEKSLEIESRSAFPDASRLSFYAPDFALSQPEPWWLGEPAEFTGFDRRPLPEMVHKAEPSSAAFARLFEEIRDEISAGTFAKVVPVVREDYEFASALAPDMFETRPRAGLWSYGFEFEGEGLSGQTPEVLFSVRDGVLETMALAGTGSAGGPSLLEDPKERHEHRLVIDHIVSGLGDWGPADVGATVERSYGILKHLYTPMRIQLKRAPEFAKLVARLHPTAALGGSPRRPAVDWLERQEFHSTRGRFGAPFGFVEGDRMLCLAAIRNIQWQGARACVLSGCGIVSGSHSLDEWRELGLKRESVFRSLGVSP